MKIIRYLNNRMGRKLKFVVGLAIAASIGWLVYEIYPPENRQLPDVSAADVSARTP